jgi:hypothetical protein
MSTNRPLFDPATGFPVFEPTGAFRPVFGEPYSGYTGCDHWNATTSEWEGPPVPHPRRTITFAGITGGGSVWNGVVENPEPDPAVYTWTHSWLWEEIGVWQYVLAGGVPGPRGTFCVWLAKRIATPTRYLQFGLWQRTYPGNTYRWIISVSAPGAYVNYEYRRWYKTHTVGANDSAGTYTVEGADGSWQEPDGDYVYADGSCVVT